MLDDDGDLDTMALEESVSAGIGLSSLRSLKRM
jgi:hypothetical protein